MRDEPTATNLIVFSRLCEHLSADRADVSPTSTLTLDFDDRRRSRARVRLDDGREAALFLPRGVVLRHGDIVTSNDGHAARVLAAKEEVSTCLSTDPHLLMRACYHLGNRHVPLEIGQGFVRYRHDHVLDHLVREMGLEVRVEHAPFEAESGGYQHTPQHTPPHEHAPLHAHSHTPPRTHAEPAPRHEHEHSAHTHQHERVGHDRLR